MCCGEEWSKIQFFGVTYYFIESMLELKCYGKLLRFHFLLWKHTYLSFWNNLVYQIFYKEVIHIVRMRKNRQNLTPPSPLYAFARTWLEVDFWLLAWIPFMRTYFLYIHPSRSPPNKFLFRFKFSSLKVSRLFSFYLSLRLNFTK